MKCTFYLLLASLALMFTACHQNNGGKQDHAYRMDSTALELMLDSVDGLYNHAEYKASLALAKELRDVAIEQKDTDYILEAFSEMLCNYQQLGYQDSAITIASNLLEIDKKRNDTESLSSDYQNLAYIYVVNKNYELAQEFIEKGIEIEKEIPGQSKLSSRYGLASEIYNNLSLNTQRKDSIALREKSLDYVEKAYVLDMEHKDTLHAARRLSQKGDVLHTLHREKGAEQAYKSAIESLERYDERHSLAITYRQLGNIYILQNRLAEALPYLEKAKDIALENNEMYALEKDYQKLYEVYKTIDAGKSTDYLKLYSEIKDSLYSMESAKSLSEFHAIYDTDKEKENAARKHHMLMITWTVSCLGALIFIALIIWALFQLRRRNLHNKLLKEQICQLKEQMEEYQQKFLEQMKIEEEKEPEMSEKDKAFMEKVNAVIFKLMGNKELTTENIALELCITSQQLLRRIRAVKDMTAIAYINKVRMEYAKQLLKERTELSIVEVGQLCGYYEATHFTRAFKKETGTTPSQFRE